MNHKTILWAAVAAAIIIVSFAVAAWALEYGREQIKAEEEAIRQQERIEAQIEDSPLQEAYFQGYMDAKQKYLEEAKQPWEW